MQASQIHSTLSGRNATLPVMTAEDVADYKDLRKLGIIFTDHYVRTMAKDMAESIAMDDLTGGVTVPSVITPVQFLQAWLPGFVANLTTKIPADILFGIQTVGAWEDEEIVQGILEHIGADQAYGDYTNIPLASWNVNFNVRTVVRRELGFQSTRLTEARSARIRVSDSAQKRIAVARQLEISRALIAFYGFNAGANLTYGALNDPSLPAYVNVTGGTWATKTGAEIFNDIRNAMAALQAQLEGNVNVYEDKITIAVANDAYGYLAATTSGTGGTYFGYTVLEQIGNTYKGARVVPVPQFDKANGGASVFYVYLDEVQDGYSTDDRMTWAQVVPARLYTLGVQPQAKGILEDYAVATAGILLKRPLAVTRWSGIL